MLTRKMAVIADDDKETLRNLVSTLEDDGFEVALALDTNHAIQLIKKVHPVLVISEIGKHNYDGLSLFESFKKEVRLINQLKMVILTNNSDEKYEILSFESGIDDFLLKPLRKNAFRKRIVRYFKEEKAPQKAPKKQYQIRDLFFNISNKSIHKLPNEEVVPIQSKTFDILLFLALNHDHIYSREALINAIWPINSKVTARSIDVHILKIRQLLGEGYIKTIKGVGYIFIKNQE